MKDLKLLSFPEKNINQERLESVLAALTEPSDEYETIDGVLVAIINFLETLDSEQAALIVHDITKLRGSIEAFYDDV